MSGDVTNDGLSKRDNADYYGADSPDLGIKFELARTPEEFLKKAQKIGSNMMDALDAKIVNGMSESSDFRVALEIMKQFKVGVSSVADEAQRYFEGDAEYVGVVEEDVANEEHLFQPSGEEG